MNVMERAQSGARPHPDAVDVTVVIVSHNTCQHLHACLASLEELGEDATLRVIVVDNDSQDGTPAMVRERFPDVRLMDNRVNVGYSSAVNQALRVAEGRYFLVLNPDVRVKAGAIDAMVRFMDETPGAGVAGGRLLNPDGTLQYSCRSFYTFRTLLYRRTVLGKIFPRSRVIRDHLMADWDHASVREVDWVLGACMLVRREAIHDVGLMDERFFLYFEDVDWCYRMKRRGWGVWYVPQSEMVHHHRRESARGGFTDPRFLAHLNSVFHFYDKWNRALFTMKRFRGQVRLLLFLLSDLVAVNAAFLIAYLLRSLLAVWLVKPLFPLSTYFLFLAFANAATIITFFAFGLYRPRPGESRGEEMTRVARALLTVFLLIMAGTFVAQTRLYSRVMIYSFWPIATVLAVGGRLCLYRVHRWLRRMRFDMRRVLLVGGGPRTAELGVELESHPELGYELVGVVGTGAVAAGGGRGSWRLEDLPRIIHDEQIEEVMIVGPDVPAGKLAETVASCRRHGVMATALTGASELVALGGRLVDVGRHQVLAFEAASWRGAEKAAKRALDVAGGAVILAVLPAVLVTHRLRRGRGDLFERLPVRGPDGRLFSMLALAPAGERGGPDSRPHDISRWRSLPQAWNVLRGEMSLVGPRPRMEPEAGVVADDAGWFRPGMTGPWRTHASLRWLGSAGNEEDLLQILDELDRRYIRHWSLALDVRIVAETIVGSGS